MATPEHQATRRANSSIEEKRGRLSWRPLNAIQGENTPMKRLLLIGFAACAFALAPTLSASAMPGANPNTLTDTDDSSIVLVKGGHGHGGGPRCGDRGRWCQR